MARSSKWLSNAHKALSFTLSILLVFGLMFTLVPIAEAAPNIQSSVSTRPVDCNLSNGPLPDNVSTLTGGSTYYINLSATVDNRFKESKLYVQNPGDSGFSCVYDCTSKGYHRYTSYKYTAPNRSGTMNYYWKVLHQSSNQWSTYKTNSRTIQAQGQSKSASSGPSRVTPFSSTQTVVIVTALNSNKALDADNAGTNAGNGTIIHLWDRNNGATQVFNIVPQGSGWYTIIHKVSGKALDVRGGNAGNGVRLQLYQQNGTKAQKFEFYDAGNGYVYIRNALGYVVDLDNGNTNNDAIIHTWQYNGGNNQKWGFLKVNKEKINNKGGEDVYNIAESYVGKKYGYFEGENFHWRKWCADYVCWCASKAGQSKAVPKNASVAGLRSDLKNKANGQEYSKADVKNGKYVPQRGDIVFFLSAGSSHVGIIDKVKNGTLYYVDGNNIDKGNGSNSRVNYSQKSVSDAGFTCVIHPNYK